MINKQVIGKEREEPGGEETPFLVPRGGGLVGLCTGERMNQWGGRDTVSGGSLEPHCLRKVFTCIHHAGARHTQAHPEAAWGMPGHQPLRW